MFNIKPRLLETTAANVGEKRDKRRDVSGTPRACLVTSGRGGGGGALWGLHTGLFLERCIEMNRRSPAVLMATCRSAFQGK